MLTLFIGSDKVFDFVLRKQDESGKVIGREDITDIGIEIDLTLRGASYPLIIEKTSSTEGEYKGTVSRTITQNLSPGIGKLWIHYTIEGIRHTLPKPSDVEIKRVA